MDEQKLRSTLENWIGHFLASGQSERVANELFQSMEQACTSWIDFRTVCENLYDGIHITDGNGKILFINQAYTRTTGLRPEDVLGRMVADIEEEGNLYKGSVTPLVLERRKQVNAVATILGLNKEVLVTGTPVFDEAGNIKLVVTNTRDFPELKRLEKQLLMLTEESKKSHEELIYLRNQQAGGRQITHHSAAMKNTMELIHTVAPTDVTVLITGESGTGKELVANKLYQESPRKGKPFIKVNCAAIPNELLESELFGYEDGAFTGARKAGKMGMFELANTGVILLDEIGDMPFSLQTKLLRVLQQWEITRIGGAHPIKIDIRVIASTNKDLKEEIHQGRFREDLYYRLNVVPIALLPLRKRKEEIPHLAEQFCQNFNKKYGKATAISPDGMEILMEYQWPGNIRELENLIERMVVTSTGESITRRSIFSALHPYEFPYPTKEATNSEPLKAQVRAFERELILYTMEQEGSLRKAAKVLGVDHSTLIKKYHSYSCEDGRLGEKNHHLR